MEEGLSGLKRENRLAVFQHVVQTAKKTRKRTRMNRYIEDSSASESELIIDDERPVKKKPPAKRADKIRLSEEPLNLVCAFESCNESFDDYDKFYKHLESHCEAFQESHEESEVQCPWESCTCTIIKDLTLQHISYHGYLTKLMNIGANVLMRNSLPECSEIKKIVFPVIFEGYICEWTDCDIPKQQNLYELHQHMQIHMRNNPKYCKGKEFVQCLWKGCGMKFPSQYKLNDHVRIHTKEKTVACPTCAALFSNKTKFQDHRKRQLSVEHQNYQCANCLKAFASERLLRDHMRSHINLYKCSMCDMTCSSPSSLAKHIRYRHLNEKHYKCNICSREFTNSHNLRTHARIHSEKDEFTCSKCKYSCKSSYGLKTHYINKHNEKSSIYECHTCSKQFERGQYLTQHFMKVHNYHWPSGHSRFRYQLGEDGIFRLQTVRYESIEVTQDLIRSESKQNSTVNTGQDEVYTMTVSQNEIEQESLDNVVLITITDVDNEGNHLNNQVVIDRVK